MNQTYRQEYQNKLVSADQAVKVVKSGDWVQYGEFVCQAIDCDAALARRKDDLRDVKIRSITSTILPEVVKVDPDKKHFIFHDWSFGAISRKLHDKDLCYHIPETYHEVPRMIKEHHVPEYDAAFFPVCPIDEHGYFNLGPTCSLTCLNKHYAKKVIVEVNTSMPCCLGGDDESIHISDVDYIVESTTNPSLLEIPKASATDNDIKIASLIMEELEDGCCLQLGIGGMPNKVGEMIANSDLKDLGVHTEMLVDSFVDLYESGRVTNQRKNINRGKMVYTFAMGSQKLYDFLDNNPACAIFPVEYTNDPFVIAQNDKVFAINNCLAVDLYGQVSSESMGARHISGTGGQMDFIFAAFRSKGGKGFVCMNSTVTRKDGTLESRIVPGIEPFTIITLPRSITYYVVTEYGIVNLKGKSNWERAEQLISIAHPDFRDELIKVAQKNRIWLPTNKITL